MIFSVDNILPCTDSSLCNAFFLNIDRVFGKNLILTSKIQTLKCLETEMTISDSYKFSANVLAYLFFLFFQGPQKGGEKASETSEKLFMGWCIRPK